MQAITHNEVFSAVEVINRDGAGDVLLLCEHASSFVPPEYDNLGLDTQAQQGHAAWDIGARSVGMHLSRVLDAPFVSGCMSRLIYDCNRPPEVPSAIPDKSELIDIPGNRGLTPEMRAARVEQVYQPFCRMVEDVIAERRAQGRDFVLVTMHSFTPVYFGQVRATEIGILSDVDTRLADAMQAQASLLPHRCIERNQPYGPEDGVTHSLKQFGLAHDAPNVMIEIRNDLISDAAGEQVIAREVAQLLTAALLQIAPGDKDA